MKKSLYLIAGILIGITLFGGSSVLAAGITAERSTNRIYVDGQEVHLTAYNINGNNYVMLRDVGRTVGFNVYWNSDAKCVQVESKKPYTGEASVTSAEAKPVEQPAQTDVAAAKQGIIDRTNALRRAKGVAALRVNDKLMQAAQVRADEMAASGVYSHTSGWAQEQYRHRQQIHWRKYSQYIGVVPRATAKNALRGGGQSVVQFQGSRGQHDKLPLRRDRRWTGARR